MDRDLAVLSHIPNLRPLINFCHTCHVFPELSIHISLPGLVSVKFPTFLVNAMFKKLSTPQTGVSIRNIW